MHTLHRSYQKAVDQGIVVVRKKKHCWLDFCDPSPGLSAVAKMGGGAMCC